MSPLFEAYLLPFLVFVLVLTRISGLSRDVLKRHRSITITFRVQ